MSGYFDGTELPVFSDHPNFSFDKAGEVIKDDRAIHWAIILSSDDGEVSPFAPGLGPCQNWTRKINPTKENRGYAMMRDPLNGRMQYVYKVLHRVCGGSDKTKWLTNPICHNKKCISPEHWAKV